MVRIQFPPGKGPLRTCGAAPSRPSADGSAPASTPNVDDLIPDLAVISARKSRDLIHGEAAHQHGAQLGQLCVRPFIHARHKAADHTQQRDMLWILPTRKMASSLPLAPEGSNPAAPLDLTMPARASHQITPEQHHIVRFVRRNALQYCLNHFG